MRAYFIRHAQSSFNAVQKHQDASVNLSELGVAQAGCVAQRLAPLGIQCLLTSSYQRAVQTAAIVGRAIDLPPQIAPLFREVKRPTEIEGRFYDDQEALRIKALLHAHYGDPAWRYSDEETFLDLRERARLCLATVTGLEAQTVAVVTHGGILTMIIATMLHGPDLQPGAFLHLQRVLSTTNTGLTICHDTPEWGWQFLTWNDHSHLDGPPPSWP